MRYYGDDGAAGNSTYSDGVYFDVTWSFVEPPPTGLLLGFEVALYKGVDATDTQNYLSPLAKVHYNDRRAVILAVLARGITAPSVGASVRPLYASGPGAWVKATATATPAPPSIRTTATDNLIPNPTSELGTALAGYGSSLVVNDAGNSYAGNYCRKLDSSAANQTNLTELIPCIYTDQFAYDCYVKGSSATPVLQLVLTFYNASGTVVGTSTSAAYTGSTVYQPISVKGAVPLGAMSVQASVKASTTAASSFLYFDNLSLRRSVRYAHMDTDSGFRVLNGFGNTGITSADRIYYRGNNDSGTRGGAPNISCLTVTRRRWDTSNKIGRLELKLQPTNANDNLDGMRPAKVQWYKQDGPYANQVSGVNLDVSINISANTATYTRASGSFTTDGYVSGSSFTAAGFTNSGNNGTFAITSITATTLTCSLTTQVTESSASGRTISSAPGLTAIDTTYPHIGDRQYLSTTDSSSSNASINSALLNDSLISGGYPAAIVTLYNALGPSDAHCFYSAVGAADGAALVDNGINFPSSFTTGGASGGTGGGSGGGGSCVTPDTLVDLWDPAASQVFQKAAGEVQAGDLAYTIHQTGTVGCWPVTAARIEQADMIHTVAFQGGLQIRFAKNHRLRIQEKGWVAVQDLQPGDMPEGTSPAAVLSIAEGPGGDVVALSVDQAASYMTSGILSSNLKPLT